MKSIRSINQYPTGDAIGTERLAVTGSGFDEVTGGAVMVAGGAGMVAGGAGMVTGGTMVVAEGIEVVAGSSEIGESGFGLVAAFLALRAAILNLAFSFRINFSSLDNPSLCFF